MKSFFDFLDERCWPGYKSVRGKKAYSPGSCVKEDLRNWFNPNHPDGNWKRVNTKGEVVGDCAREPGEPKPKCMSQSQRDSLSKKEKASAVRRKRKEDPNAERQGAPINVKSKVNENMEQLDEKNEPTNPELWSRAIAQAKSKFDVYPSAYANGWASKWYKQRGGGWKTVSEAKEKTEYDYEGDMARGQLQSIISNAQRVHDMLEDDTNIAEWVQSKITLAEDYISTVANYMMSELDESVDLNEASSAAVRMQRALDKIKQSREASERRAQELLKPKPKNEKVELDEVSTDGYHAAAVKSRMGAAVKMMTSMGSDKQAKTKLDARNAGLKRLSDRTPSEMKKANSGPQKSTPSKTPTEAERRGYGQGRYMGDSVEVTDNQINEARPSQRHPLEGHEYHKKSDEALIHIAKDAHSAAEAMKGHNTTAENKYRDQANDSATVRHFRKTSGTPDWYKKKYGHVKEEVVNEVMDEPNYNNSIEARQKKADNAAKRFMDNSVQDRQKKADDAGKRFMQGADKPPFDPPYRKTQGVVTDKSGAKHSGMSIAKHLAKTAASKQSEFLKARNAGSNTKNARARAAGANMSESRKVEIVKDIIKKSKKKNDSTFQSEPVLGTTIVKND